MPHYDPAVPVWTAWDLGIGDATSIVCAQLVGREVHVIDYYEATGEPLTHYVRWLDSKPYRYGTDLLLRTTRRRVSWEPVRPARNYLEPMAERCAVVPRQDVDDGINATKMLLPRCWMDRVRTERLRECLAHYHRDFNDRMGVFKDAPVHDWSSHAADAVRTLAMGLKEARPDTGVDEFVRRQIAPDRTWHEGLGRNTSWMGV